MRRLPLLILLLGLVTLPPCIRADFVDAPDVETKVSNVELVEKAVQDFEREILRRKPRGERGMQDAIASFGNGLGLGSDMGTLLLEATNTELNATVEDCLGNVGLALTSFTLLEKQFARGEPAGLDALYETAKFLISKIPQVGKVTAAGMAILKWQADSIGNAAMAQIQRDNWNFFKNYQRKSHPDPRFWWRIFAQEDGQKRLLEEIDKFWLESGWESLRGWGMLLAQYESNRNEVKQAFLDRFLREEVHPSLLQAAEQELMRIRVKAEERLAKTLRHLERLPILVDLKPIIDVGTGRPPKDVEAFLSHGDDLLVARAPVKNGRVRFLCPSKKLRDPKTGRRILNVVVNFRSKEPATLQPNPCRIFLRLFERGPRCRRRLEKDCIHLSYKRPIHFRRSLPVELRLEGLDDERGSLTVSSSPKIDPNGLFAMPWSRKMERKDGVYRHPAVPTGRLIFTHSDAGLVGTGVLDSSRSFTFEVALATTARASLQVPKPPSLAVSQEQQNMLGRLGTGKEYLTDLLATAGALGAEGAHRLALWTAEIQKIKACAKRKGRAIRKADLKDEEKEALEKGLAQEQESLYSARKQAEELRSRLHEESRTALRKARKAEADSHHALEKDFQDLDSRLRTATQLCETLAREIEKILAELFQEAHSDNLAYQKPADCDTRIEAFEAKLAALDALMSKWEEGVEDCSTLETSLDEQGKKLAPRLRSRDRAPRTRPSFQGELLRRRLSTLKAEHATEKAGRALALLKRRRERRKRFQRRFDELIGQGRVLIAKLPAPPAPPLETLLESSLETFAAFLNGKGEAESLAALSTGIASTLDGLGPIASDLRRGGKASPSEFSRLDLVLDELVDLLQSRLVFAHWELTAPMADFYQQTHALRSLRRRTLAPLARLENEIAEARKAPKLYAQKMKALALPLTERLDELQAKRGKAPGPGAASLDPLQTLWEETTGLPLPLQAPLRERLQALAWQLASHPGLLAQAKASHRPLLVFTAVQVVGTNPMTPPSKLNDPACHRLKKRTEGSYRLEGRLVGVPESLTPTVRIASADFDAEQRADGKGIFSFVLPYTDAPFTFEILGLPRGTKPLLPPFMSQLIVDAS